MRKRRYLALVGTFVLALFGVIVGCGKKQDEDPPINITKAEKKADDKSNLVNFNKAKKENIKYFGDKTSSSLKIDFTNNTKFDITEFYVAKSDADDEDDNKWGKNLLGNKMIAEKENIYFYFLSQRKEDNYDVKIILQGDNENGDYYFRNLPLGKIKKLSFYMDDSSDIAIPFAKYTLIGSNEEISTLNEVKERLGIEVNKDEEKESLSTTPEATEKSTVKKQEKSVNQEMPEVQIQGETDEIRKAKEYIGRPLDTFIGVYGEPTKNDYTSYPETGKTGYHYYNGYTVSTVFDDNGNEIVSGIY